MTLWFELLISVGTTAHNEVTENVRGFGWWQTFTVNIMSDADQVDQHRISLIFLS